jgi:hypothetical protein
MPFAADAIDYAIIIDIFIILMILITPLPYAISFIAAAAVLMPVIDYFIICHFISAIIDIFCHFSTLISLRFYYFTPCHAAAAAPMLHLFHYADIFTPLPLSPLFHYFHLIIIRHYAILLIAGFRFFAY